VLVISKEGGRKIMTTAYSNFETIGCVFVW
jgi:hypothetical protein